MNEEVLKLIREKGILLEKEIFDLLNGFHDTNAALELLDGLERFSGQKMINRALLNKNFSYVKNFASKLPGEDRNAVESTIVKLGLSLEITKETEVVKSEKGKLKEQNERDNRQGYKVFYSATRNDKKLEVEDFVGNFRARYQQLQ